MPDDFDETQHGSTTGQALSIIGSLIGGASGRPLGSGLMALGNLVNQKTYDSWEIQNRQKNEIPMFQKHLNLTDDETKYLAGLSRPQYEAAKGTLLARMFQKQKQEVPVPVWNAQLGQEQYVSPTTGQVVSTFPKGDATAPFMKELQPQSPQEAKTAIELFQQDPAAFARYREMLKAGGETDVPKTPFELYQKDPAAFAQYQATVTGDKLAGEKPQISWRWTTKDGRAVQMPFKYNPATGGLDPVSVTGEPGGLSARLNAAQQKQVDSVNEVQNSLPLLESYATALPKDTTPAQMVREYAKYRAHGLMGAPNPRFTDYFDLLGQTKTALLGARIGGLSKSQSIINQLSPHIPDPTDMPSLAMEKMRSFNAGALNSTMQAILGPGTPTLSSIPSSLAPTGMPPQPTFGYTRSQHRGNDWRVLGTDGRWHQYDWASGQWQ